MIIGREALAALIPQKGTMCLLDGVDYWDDQRIICTSTQHRSAANPLRTRAGLSSLHGIEFAAQAMAAHGGLTASSQPRPGVGLLLSARDCVFHCRRLDAIVAPLTVEAQQMGSNDETRLYRFKVSAQGLPLVEGRAAVMLRAGAGL
jgi:predicted hotdog family 3-hydroxylacyl-ACP dehydratase